LGPLPPPLFGHGGDRPHEVGTYDVYDCVVCSICGTLHSVDQFLNIKLTDIIITDPEKYPHMVTEFNCCICDYYFVYVAAGDIYSFASWQNWLFWGVFSALALYTGVGPK